MRKEDRFWSKVQKTSGCWHWRAAKDLGGYGQFWLDGRMRYAHRIAYEMMVGPIPEGLTIDHLCRTRDCVNPAHMEPVTLKENVLRGETVTGLNKAKTHCLRGHPLVEGNLYRKAGDGRACRECALGQARMQRACDLI